MDKINIPGLSKVVGFTDRYGNAAAFTHNQLSNGSHLFGVRTLGGEHVTLTEQDARDLLDWLTEKLAPVPLSEPLFPALKPITDAVMALDPTAKDNIEYVFESLKSNEDLAQRNLGALRDIAQHIATEETGEIRLDDAAVITWHDHEGDVKCVSVITDTTINALIGTDLAGE